LLLILIIFTPLYAVRPSVRPLTYRGHIGEVSSKAITRTNSLDSSILGVPTLATWSYGTISKFRIKYTPTAYFKDIIHDQQITWRDPKARS